MGRDYGERPTSHTKGQGVLWGLVPATAGGPVQAKSVFSLISYGVQMPLTSQVWVMTGWCVHTNFNNFLQFLQCIRTDWPTGALDLVSIPWGKIDSEEPFMGNPIISVLPTSDVYVTQDLFWFLKEALEDPWRPRVFSNIWWTWVVTELCIGQQFSK